MKRTVTPWVFVLAALALVLSACEPQSAQEPTLVPSATPPPPAAVEPPTLVPSPTLVGIDLGGPVMEVGATYPYVDGSVLVAVPAGEFTMGYGNEDNLEHKVTLNGFWIYQDEVTNGQYALCVTLGKCSPPNTDINQNYVKFQRRNDPVTGVNWDQAKSYCEFVNGRLPTEAEWEKTARGPNGNIYPWGDATAACDLLNAGNCKTETTSVGSYEKGVSYYGAADMAGNVSEWVADWYDLQYYKVSPLENPLGPETGVFRSVRSTSYHSEFYLAAAARRFREEPIKQREDLGFRCVVEDPSLFAPWCTSFPIVNPDTSGGGPDSTTLPVPDCPSVSVTSNGFCNKNLKPPEPGAVLDFGTDPLPGDALITYPPGCVLDGSTADPTDYYCSGPTGEGSATIKAHCTVPPPPAPPGCAAGYTQSGDTCIYTGGLPGATCLPGVPFSAANQCCAAIPGGTDSYTLCPVTAPYNVGGVCMPWPLETLVSGSVSVGLGVCEGTTTDDGCQLTAAICRQTNPKTPCLNERLCTCVPALTSGACP